MTIFLPIKLALTGGTSTFAKKFQAGMKKRGHKVIFSYQSHYDVLLASPTVSWRHLLNAKRSGKKIVHRLDGMYYPTTSVRWLYPLHNLQLRIIRNYFADAIVYQSSYSQYCAERFLGGRLDKRTRIIYNGVDTNHFSPNGASARLRDTHNQHIFITTGRFRRADQIEPVIMAFKTYCERYHRNSKLVIIGNFSAKLKHISSRHASNSRIIFLGIISNNSLPEYLRAGDIFLFTHLNPPCPNNILEAMACGLPICGIADGAMPELVESRQQGLLAPAIGDAFLKPRRYNSDELADQMHRLVTQRERYSAASRRRACEKFSLEDMVSQYIKVFSEL